MGIEYWRTSAMRRSSDEFVTPAHARDTRSASFDGACARSLSSATEGRHGVRPPCREQVVIERGPAVAQRSACASGSADAEVVTVRVVAHACLGVRAIVQPQRLMIRRAE